MALIKTGNVLINKHNQTTYGVLCTCGKELYITSYWLDKKVGCNSCRLKRMTKTNCFRRKGQTEKEKSIINTWAGMNQRCLNPKSERYYCYGKRGIKIMWESFQEFYKDMERGWFKGCSIDRINVDGDYCKENCRWATIKEQSRNKRNSKLILYKGEKITVMELSRVVNIPHKTMFNWYHKFGGQIMLEKAILRNTERSPSHATML